MLLVTVPSLFVAVQVYVPDWLTEIDDAFATVITIPLWFVYVSVMNLWEKRHKIPTTSLQTKIKLFCKYLCIKITFYPDKSIVFVFVQSVNCQERVGFGFPIAAHLIDTAVPADSRIRATSTARVLTFKCVNCRKVSTDESTAPDMTAAATRLDAKKIKMEIIIERGNTVGTLLGYKTKVF